MPTGWKATRMNWDDTSYLLRRVSVLVLFVFLLDPEKGTDSFSASST
jgi:hypothetical protein